MLKIVHYMYNLFFFIGVRHDNTNAKKMFIMCTIFFSLGVRHDNTCLRYTYDYVKNSVSLISSKNNLQAKIVLTFGILECSCLSARRITQVCSKIPLLGQCRQVACLSLEFG